MKVCLNPAPFGWRSASTRWTRWTYCAQRDRGRRAYRHGSTGRMLDAMARQWHAAQIILTVGRRGLSIKRQPAYRSPATGPGRGYTAAGDTFVGTSWRRWRRDRGEMRAVACHAAAICVTRPGAWTRSPSARGWSPPPAPPEKKFSPRRPGERSGIVSFTPPPPRSAPRRFTADRRTWRHVDHLVIRAGRLRASPHFYNTRADRRAGRGAALNRARIGGEFQATSRRWGIESMARGGSRRWPQRGRRTARILHRIPPPAPPGSTHERVARGGGIHGLDPVGRDFDTLAAVLIESPLSPTVRMIWAACHCRAMASSIRPVEAMPVSPAASSR